MNQHFDTLVCSTSRLKNRNTSSHQTLYEQANLIIRLLNFAIVSLIKGETLLIWNFKDYMSVPKWRDDAIRRSKKNRDLLLMQNDRSICKRRKGSRTRRFREVCDKLRKEVNNVKKEKSVSIVENKGPL